MSSYSPGPVPTGGLRAWLATELRTIANCFDRVDNLTLPALAAEPAKLRNGMVVYADGATWDPGSGAGFYGRQAGAWVKL